jgi:hypothetical protein
MDRNFVITGRQPPSAEQIRKRPLSFAQALVGGLLEPGGSTDLIGLASLAFGKHDGEVVLCKPVAALSSLLIPRYGLCQVPWHTLGSAKHDRELKL